MRAALLALTATLATLSAGCRELPMRTAGAIARPSQGGSHPEAGEPVPPEPLRATDAGNGVRAAPPVGP